jgi:hypothetical protein
MGVIVMAAAGVWIAADYRIYARPMFYFVTSFAVAVIGVGAVAAPTHYRVRLLRRVGIGLSATAAVLWGTSALAQVCVPYTASKAWGLATGCVYHLEEEGRPPAQVTWVCRWASQPWWIGGFMVGPTGVPREIHYWPLWQLASGLLLSTASLWLVGGKPPKRRIRSCVNCGYDLMGNVTGICSECGSCDQRGSES